MEKRVRKPHYLMNDIIVYPIRPFKRTELTRSIPDDTLDFKSFHKFKTPRHHVTTLDKADGEVRIPRRRLYHEITGHHMKDHFSLKDPETTSFGEYFKNKEDNKVINYRFEEGKNSFLNIFGILPMGVNKV